MMQLLPMRAVEKSAAPASSCFSSSAAAPASSSAADALIVSDTPHDRRHVRLAADSGAASGQLQASAADDTLANSCSVAPTTSAPTTALTATSAPAATPTSTAVAVVTAEQLYPSIFRSKRRSVRILWTLFLSISFAMCTYMIVASVHDYLNYEVITKIRVFNEKPALFPTITICNKNPFVTPNASLYLSRFVIHTGGPSANQSKLTDDTVMFTNLFEAGIVARNPNFTDAERKSLGYSMEEMLIRCHFGEMRCGPDDFQWYYDFNYGNCYRFNSGFDSSGQPVPIKSVQKAGRFSGLYLQLFIGRPQQLYLSEFSSGVHVTISNNTIVPTLSEGINAMPGAITNIDIVKVFTSRMPQPFSECHNLADFDSHLYRTLAALNYTYRQKDCFDVCLQEQIIAECRCYDLQYVQLDNETGACLEKEQIECCERVYYAFIQRDISQQCSDACPLECDSVSYELSTSMASYPTRVYAKMLKTRPMISRHFKSDEDITLAKLKESLLALDINYAALRYTTISEKASKTIIDLLASIGGTLGLFLGTSLLSMLELFQNFWKIFVIFRRNRRLR